MLMSSVVTETHFDCCNVSDAGGDRTYEIVFDVVGLPVSQLIDPVLLKSVTLSNSVHGEEDYCHDDVKMVLRFGVISASGALSSWGAIPENTLILEEQEEEDDTDNDTAAASSPSTIKHAGGRFVGKRSLVMASADPLPFSLEYRFVIVAVDRRSTRIVAIDNRFTHPSQVALTFQGTSPSQEEGENHHRKPQVAVIKVNLLSGEESMVPLLHLQPIANGIRCACPPPPLVERGSGGPYLHVILYGCNARRGYSLEEYHRSLDPSVACRLDSSATSLFTVKRLEFRRCSGTDWNRRIVPNKHRKTLRKSASGGSHSALDQQQQQHRDGGGSSPSAGAASILTAHPSPASKECFDGVVEPLTHIPPLCTNDEEAGNGIRRDVTADCWTCTVDLSKTQNWIPVVILTSNLKPSILHHQKEDDDGEVAVPLMPDLFATHTSGCVAVPVVLERGTILTSMYIQYMEVTSFTHPIANSYRILRSQEGLDHLTLDTLVGHRGLGKTYTSRDSSNMQRKLAENSLESFNAAHARGCQCVEFDVMLTKDCVPILFHDAVLQLDARGKQIDVSVDRTAPASSSSSSAKKSSSATSGASPATIVAGGTRPHSRTSSKHAPKVITPFDTVPIAIHQLTYRQISGSVTKACQDVKTCTLRDLMLKHWVSLLELAESRNPSSLSLQQPSQYPKGGPVTPTFAAAVDEASPTESLSESPLVYTPAMSANSAVSPLLGTPLKAASSSQQQQQRHHHFRPRVASHHAGSTRGVADRSRFVDASAPHRLITNHIPTLQEFFDSTPSTLRLDLEVKYPFQPVADSQLYLQTDHFEVNTFVNSILDVVFDNLAHQPDREIVFCSFDPDVCVALMFKQCRFHVLYLSDTEEHVDLKDYRSFEVETALQFANAESLAGVSICAMTLMAEEDKQLIPPAADVRSWTRQIKKLAGPRVPSLSDISLFTDQLMAERWATISTQRGRSLVDCAHRHNLKVWTWGDRNSDPHFAFLQAQEMRVDAVISDNVPLWSNASVGRYGGRHSNGSGGGGGCSSSEHVSGDDVSPARSRSEDISPSKT